jgi:hypothetical protein
MVSKTRSATARASTPNPATVVHALAVIAHDGS